MNMEWYEKCTKVYVESATSVVNYINTSKFTDLIRALINDNRGNHIKITQTDEYGVTMYIDTKVLAITSLSESSLYIIRDINSLRDIMYSVLDFETNYKLISIDENLDIKHAAGYIRLFRGNYYKCEVVPDVDVNPSSESTYKEWEKRITTIMTNWVIESGFNNKFSVILNELPTDLINKALELGCKIKIKPRENASLKTGLYRLTVIPPKNEEYTEEK